MNRWGVMQAFPGNFSVFLESNSTIRKYYCRILIQLGFQGNCSPNKFIGDFYVDGLSLSHRIR